jgi:SM-20-related protein
MNAPVLNHFLIFSRIAERLRSHGYCVIDQAFDPALTNSLQQYAAALQAEGDMQRAGIGRGDDQILKSDVRKDRIHWLTAGTPAAAQWLATMESMRLFLNQELLLGLFSYESHIAHYAPGDFYRKHLDAFQGESNRILSTVYYLNADWQPENGGELVIYDTDDRELERVSPAFNRLVIFLSEEFPHEVKPALADRYSIAGWFRLNGSSRDRVDPPR